MLRATTSSSGTPIVVTTGDYALFEELYGKATEKNVIEFLTFDARNPNSIIYTDVAREMLARWRRRADAFIAEVFG